MVKNKGNKSVKKTTAKKTEESLGSQSKTNAFITTFFSIFGFIIALLSWKKDNYVMFYAKQSLVLFIGAIIVSIIDAIVRFIPVLGWIIRVALGILLFVVWLLSWIYALSGEKKDVLIIGEFAKKIDL